MRAPVCSAAQINRARLFATALILFSIQAAVEAADTINNRALSNESADIPKVNPVDVMPLSQAMIEFIIAADDETVELLLNEEVDFDPYFIGQEDAGS